MKSTVRNASVFPVVLAALLGIGAAAPAAAQQVEKVTLPTARTVGETYVLEIRSAKSRTRGGKNTASGSTWRLNARVDAVAADGGHVLRLETVDVDLAMPPESEQAGGMVKVFNDAMRRLMAVPIVLDMAPEGSVQGLRNKDQALAFAHDLVAATRKELLAGKTPVDAKLLDRVLTPLTQPSMLENSLLEPFTLLYFLSGVDLEMGETYVLDDEVPFPLTGTPLRSRILFAAKKVDRAAGTATFDMRREIEPEDFHKAIKDFFTGFLRAAGKELPPDTELPFDQFVLETTATYVYSLETGLPVSLRFVKQVSAPGGSQVETKDIDVRPAN
ncbi:MAG: hypothetical protein H6907_16635 [Hyphomicrobiales bacterium]|nr:hypothetical protein [Hyphomicrobiales bacterium]MCP5373355.1 hypothetical protein [Hyphomicrobiales bacterium]